jgi:thioredoxin-dependent peroxiredoxin
MFRSTSTPFLKGSTALLDAGAKVPRITVLDDSGKAVNTGDLLQKTLVLWFYPKDDTPG